MAIVGPYRTVAYSIGATGALALVICLAGRGERPAELAFDDARPIPLPAAASVVCPPDLCQAATELAMLPPIDAGELLPPQPLPSAGYTEWSGNATDRLIPLPPLEPLVLPLAIATAGENAGGAEASITPSPTGAAEAEADAHTAEARLLLADASPSATGLPTGAIVTERAQAKIRRGYALAQRGANYAARSEFLQVLRMIAEAKDQAFGARRRTTALANGLRALDEASDFTARSPDADCDVSLAVILSSHRTPIAQSCDVDELLPQQLADLYFRYAQLQLGAAVAGESAGSMALHALGKLYSQLGRVEPDNYVQADRRAFALQQAALLARGDNHLAAHELGVLLAESGHYAESEILLGQVASRQPHAVVYRNLARVQRKLGRTPQALYNEGQAHILASRDPSVGGQVTWVRPDAMASGQGMNLAETPTQVASREATSGSRAAGATAPARPSNTTRSPGQWMR